jgi:hypothetical protein
MITRMSSILYIFERCYYSFCNGPVGEIDKSYSSFVMFGNNVFFLTVYYFFFCNFWKKFPISHSRFFKTYKG